MPISIKRITCLLIVILIIFDIAYFSISNSLSLHVFLQDQLTSGIKCLINKHCANIFVNARHYLLLPEGGYDETLFTLPLSFPVIARMISNAIFNVIFQPLFFCIFTPQVILNYFIFPFFIYGAIRYFTRVPIIILAFLGLSVYVGFNGSIVESLIRHRMICDLIYLLIGTAGFIDVISKNLSY